MSLPENENPGAFVKAISMSDACHGRAEVKQTSLGNHQIRQSEQRHQLRRVLGHSAVTDLLQPKVRISRNVTGDFAKA